MNDKLIRIAFLSVFSLFSSLQAQILTVVPENPTADDTVTVIFDAREGNAALAGYEGAVYAHTGVIIGTVFDPSGWRYVQGNWGEDDLRMKMEPLGNDRYRIRYHIRSFYGFGPDEPFLQLSFVFRNKDGSLVGKDSAESDIFYPRIKVYPNGPLEQVSGADGLNSGDLIGIRPYEKGTVLVEGTEASLLLQSFGEGVIRVVRIKPGSAIPPVSDAVVAGAVPLRPFWPEERNRPVIIRWEGDYSIHVSRSPMHLEFRVGDEKVLAEEKGIFRDDAEGIAGARFALSPTEHIYGTGSRAINIDRRGQRLYAYNTANYGYTLGETALNISIPFVMSSRGYGLYFDNPKRGYFDIDANEKDVLEFGAMDTTMSYFVILGADPAQILKRYTRLTGFQPIPPLWALGYIQSRFGYKSQKETIDVVKRTLEAGFPMDAVLLDLYWFGEIKDMGNLEWQPDSFPDPKAMVSTLDSMGVKTVMITETYVVEGSRTFPELDSLGYFTKNEDGSTYVIPDFWAGPAGLMDIIRPEVREWFWPYYKKLMDIGIGGWWCDSGEPENHPKKMIHSIGTAEEAHNLYGQYWSRMIFEGYRKDYPGKRLFNLARSGYAGMQRYATFPWSGDVSRSWNALRAQTPIMLGIGTCGIGYMHSDLGGFTGGPLNEELYRRWVQFGVFVPVMRTHGSGLPSEPVYFSEKTQDIVRQAVKMRYRMLPYNYTLAWENHTTGSPLARPMFFHYPDDANVHQLDDQYLWGENLLVAPVFEDSATSRKLYLPEGNWFDIRTAEKIKGSRFYTSEVEPYSIPVFAKGGAFLPLWMEADQTLRYAGDKFRVVWFADPEAGPSAYQLYQDDGHTPDAFAKGEYCLTSFSGTASESLIEVQVSATGEYSGMPATREITLEIPHVQEMPLKVKVNDKKAKLSSDMTSLDQETLVWDKGRKILLYRFMMDGTETSLRIEGNKLFGN